MNNQHHNILDITEEVDKILNGSLEHVVSDKKELVNEDIYGGVYIGQASSSMENPLYCSIKDVTADNEGYYQPLIGSVESRNPNDYPNCVLPGDEENRKRRVE